MPEDRRLTISTSSRLHPDEVARHTFGTARRGFDPAEVRVFLEQIAHEMQAAADREEQWRAAVDEAEHRAAERGLGLGQAFPIGVDEHRWAAEPGQPLCERPPDPGARAGDHDRAPGQRCWALCCHVLNLTERMAVLAGTILAWIPSIMTC